MNTNKEAFVDQMRNRTKQLAVDIIYLYRKLPPTEDARIIGKQLLRSATSVAANYRAVCRARSRNEFYSKLCITVEESDETSMWLELIIASGIEKDSSISELLKESNEILAILTTARKKVSTYN